MQNFNPLRYYVGYSHVFYYSLHNLFTSCSQNYTKIVRRRGQVTIIF